MTRQQQRRRNQAGFTIIELMIATSIFSVILIMATALMINIGTLYYKGVSQAKSQDTTRTIVDDLANHLRLAKTVYNPAAATPENGQNVYALCTDSTRYSYVLGVKIGSSLPHVLWRDTLSTPGACTPADLTQSVDPSISGGVAGTGAELIGSSTRLTAFSLSSTTSPYSITVGVAYGDLDLTNFVAQGPNVACLGGAGQQYCSTAYLSTTVDKRSE